MSNATTGGRGIEPAHRRVIFASSLGTVFEWYDFYLYGALSAIISRQFFAGVNETTGFIFALLAFAAGFFVRPFGALLFGRLGDLAGRKHTFLITIVIMGISTALVGVLPNYASIGIAAPILLVVLRLLQGLALGGEYGGAATYVAEHAPEGRRGYYTSWIQTTATLGLFLSLIVILVCRVVLGPEFETWGWRIPFLLSIVLLGISVYIRLQLQESPVFTKMREEGTLSRAPLKEAFANRANLKLVLLALFGATAGQAVIWYGGQFYSLFFLEKVLQVEPRTANIVMIVSLAIATPLFLFFGALSDRIGRKTVVLAGCALAVLTYFPTFKAITHFANPALEAAVAAAPVSVIADPRSCTLQFDPLGRRAFTSACDVAKSSLAKAGVPYTVVPAGTGQEARVRIGEGEGAKVVNFGGDAKGFQVRLKDALAAAGYPQRADPEAFAMGPVIALTTWLVMLVTMVYGPIAAWLVELFPARIRYSAMSLPYHVGNGWFGGFLPVTAFAIVAATGNLYAGLWYPVLVAAMTLVIGALFLPETTMRTSAKRN